VERCANIRQGKKKSNYLYIYSEKKNSTFPLGKVVWFTALFPYVVLAILAIRALFLPGSSQGLEYYLTPNITTLYSASVWMDAASRKSTFVYFKFILTF
jgi:hypothetical protein